MWQGGTSFQGGFLGVILAILLFARHYKQHWFSVTDFIAPMVPPGLAFGRLGNFINAELPRRPTDGSWAMIFPQVDEIGHHPSQLYQAALEGLTLFILLCLFAKKPRPMGAVSGLRLIGYGLFRFRAGFAREPDEFLGLLALNFSIGQWLSLPMMIGGIAMLLWAYCKVAAC